MGSEMPFHDFVRRFSRFGVHVSHGRNHLKMKKLIRGKWHLYVVAVKRNKVDHIYVRKARRRFLLLPENGVSDEEFYNA